MLIGGALDALVVRDDPLTACHSFITGSYQPERLQIEGSWKMSNSPIQFAAVYGNDNWKHHAMWTTFNNTEMGQQVHIITHTRQRTIIYPAYPILYIQYHGCRWSGGTWGQGFSSHVINLVLPKKILKYKIFYLKMASKILPKSFLSESVNESVLQVGVNWWCTWCPGGQSCSPCSMPQSHHRVKHLPHEGVLPATWLRDHRLTWGLIQYKVEILPA